MCLTMYFPRLQAEQLLTCRAAICRRPRTSWWSAHSIPWGLLLCLFCIYLFRWDAHSQSIRVPQTLPSLFSLPVGERGVPWALLSGLKVEMSWCDQRDAGEFAHPSEWGELPLCKRCWLCSSCLSYLLNTVKCNCLINLLWGRTFYR